LFMKNAMREYFIQWLRKFFSIGNRTYGGHNIKIKYMKKI